MNPAKKIKYKQYLLVISLMAGTYLFILLFSSWLKNSNETIETGKSKQMSIPSAAQADLQSHWVQRLENKNKFQAEQLNEAMKKLEVQNQAIEKIKSELSASISDLVKKLDEKANTTSTIPNYPSSADPFASQGSQVNREQFAYDIPKYEQSMPAQALAPQLIQPLAPSIVSHQFKLASNTKKHRVGKYLPAGSFVKTIILGGIDAPAGVTAQSEPRPVLLRLVDLSVLPNRARHNIKDCHVIAAGYGDISSERAYLRTERISCTLNSGIIYEQKIKAYITGEDGKDGIRGNVVRKEGDLLFNSFMAGAVSGLGKTMSQSFGTTSTSPLGSTKSMSGQDVMRSGAYGGVGEGADSLQKYFIQRAEQMQPVIQISAGREVTIVILEGVELDAFKNI